ncbi:hypothetical protein [Spirillospora sp. NPDC029432]|uniref:hypothetical protein n=1 Tax=Spirillospora sp. NPDC029432 TaxID=3154599 RepID=UPI0034528472
MTQQATDPRPDLDPIDTSELRGADLARFPGSALMRALAEIIDPLRSPTDPPSGFGNNLSG